MAVKVRRHKRGLSVKKAYDIEVDIEVIDLNEPMEMPSVFSVKAKNIVEARHKARKILRKNFPHAKENKDYTISAIISNILR